MEDRGEQAETLDCALCNGPCTEGYSLGLWIRIATIRSILQEHIPARAEEFKSSSGFICGRCYHAMDNLIRKKQEATEAENFVQFLAKQTTTKQELVADDFTDASSEKEVSTPIKVKHKGFEGGTQNVDDLDMERNLVTQTRSGREYTKRKLQNLKSTVPEKTLKKNEIDSSSKQLSSCDKGKQKALPSRTEMKSIKTLGNKKSISQIRSRGRPKKLSEDMPSPETSRNTEEVGVGTSEKRGRGRPRKPSISTSSPETSINKAAVVDTSQKRGRGRPRKLSMGTPSSEFPRSTEQFDVGTIQKRGRGRPRKLSAEMVKSSTELNAINSSKSITSMSFIGQPKTQSAEIPLKETTEKSVDKLSRLESGFRKLTDVGSEQDGSESPKIFSGRTEIDEDGVEQDCNEEKGTSVNSNSDLAGEISTDHSYYVESQRLSEQENVEKDQISNISDESENVRFTDDMNESEEFLPENEHSEDEFEASTNKIDQATPDEINTQNIKETARPKIMTRIGSGTISRKFVAVDKKKRSKTDKLAVSGESLLTSKTVTVLHLNPDNKLNSGGTPKKLVFLKACDLKAQKLPTVVKESESESEKRIMPPMKARQRKDRNKKARSTEITVNPEIWTCKLCKVVKYKARDIENHIRTEHKLTNDDEIEQCFSKRVVNLVTQKNMNTNVQERLRNFLQTKEVISYTCMICELKIGKENNALTHVRMTHAKSKEDAPSFIKRNITLERLNKEDSDSNVALARHTRKSAEQLKVEKRNRRRVMRCVKEHFQTKVSKWKCKICGAMYVSNSALRRHIVKQHIVADSDIKANSILVQVDREIKTRLEDEDEDSKESMSENDTEIEKPVHEDGTITAKSQLESENSQDVGMENGKKGVISGRGRRKHGHNKPWRCGLCTIYYFHKCDVHRHLMLKHGLTREDAKSYVIQEKWQEAANKKYFATKVEVYTINNQGEDDNEIPVDTEDEEELDPYNKTQKPWKCIKCGKRLPTRKAALRHMRFPHEIYGPWARYHVRQIAPEQGSKSKKLEDEFHLDRNILCVLCGRDYMNQVQAMQHTKDCHPDISDNMAADVLLKKSSGSKLIVLSLPGEVTRSYHIDSKGRIREVDMENITSLKQKTGVWDKKTYTFFDDERVESDAEIIDEEKEIPLITSSEELNVTHTNIFFLKWENYRHTEEESSSKAQSRKPWQCNRCHKGLSNKLTGVQHVAHVHDINGPWARHFLRKNDEWNGLLEGTTQPERDWLCVYCGRHYKSVEDAQCHVKGWHPNLTAQMQKSLVLQKSGGCKGIILSMIDGAKLTFLIDSFGRIKEMESKSADFEDFIRRYSFNCQQEDSIIDVDDKFDPQFVDTDPNYSVKEMDQKGGTITKSTKEKKLKKMVSLLSSKSAVTSKAHQENDTDMTANPQTIVNSLDTDDSVATEREQKIHVYKCSNPNAKKEYVCKSCPLVLSSNKHASYHRLYHRHAVRWRCRKCGEAFYYISHLTEHIHKVHGKSLLSIILDMEEILDNKPYPITMATSDLYRDESSTGKEDVDENLVQSGMSDNNIFNNHDSFVTSVEEIEETVIETTASVQASETATNNMENSLDNEAVEGHDSSEKNNREPNDKHNTENINSSGQEEGETNDPLDFESGDLNPNETRKGKMSCEVCGLFVPVENIKKHKTLFHGVLTMRCMECQQDYDTLEALDQHVLEVHEGRSDNDKRIHPCIICNTVWRNRPDLLNHLDRHKTDGCRCTICGKAFDNMNRLKSHMSVHNCSYTNDKHECLICGRSIVAMKSFLSHTRNHYDEYHKVFQCEVCKKFVKTRSCLAEHMKNHTHEEMLCPYCAKQFTSRVNYLRHLKYHENPELFSCPQCGLQLSTLTGLRRHQRFHHTVGQGKTVCHICGKSLRHMKWHLQNAHSNEIKESKRPPKKNRKCNFCGKVFKLPHMMERHRVVHTGEKPFKCPVCNKTFRFRTSLKAHVNTHPEYQPYKCAVCETHFQLEKDFMEHKIKCRSGENEKEFPFQCEVCHRVFRSIRSLRMHLDRKHETEKHDKLPGSIRYNCQICNKGFFYKDSLNRHTSFAHKERNKESVDNDYVIVEETSAMEEEEADNISHTLYKCNLCEKVFNLLEELKEHVDTDHSKPIVADINIEVIPDEQGNDLDSNTIITLEHEQAAQLFNHLQLQMGEGQELVNVIIPMTK